MEEAVAEEAVADGAETEEWKFSLLLTQLETDFGVYENPNTAAWLKAAYKEVLLEHLNMLQSIQNPIVNKPNFIKIHTELGFNFTYSPGQKSLNDAYEHFFDKLSDTDLLKYAMFKTSWKGIREKIKAHRNSLKKKKRRDKNKNEPNADQEPKAKDEASADEPNADQEPKAKDEASADPTVDVEAASVEPNAHQEPKVKDEASADPTVDLDEASVEPNAHREPKAKDEASVDPTVDLEEASVEPNAHQEPKDEASADPTVDVEEARVEPNAHQEPKAKDEASADHKNDVEEANVEPNAHQEPKAKDEASADHKNDVEEARAEPNADQNKDADQTNVFHFCTTLRTNRDGTGQVDILRPPTLKSCEVSRNVFWETFHISCLENIEKMIKEPYILVENVAIVDKDTLLVWRSSHEHTSLEFLIQTLGEDQFWKDVKPKSFYEEWSTSVNIQPIFRPTPLFQNILRNIVGRAFSMHGKKISISLSLSSVVFLKEDTNYSDPKFLCRPNTYDDSNNLKMMLGGLKDILSNCISQSSLSPNMFVGDLDHFMNLLEKPTEFLLDHPLTWESPRKIVHFLEWYEKRNFKEIKLNPFFLKMFNQRKIFEDWRNKVKKHPFFAVKMDFVEDRYCRVYTDSFDSLVKFIRDTAVHINHPMKNIGIDGFNYEQEVSVIWKRKDVDDLFEYWCPNLVCFLLEITKLRDEKEKEDDLDSSDNLKVSGLEFSISSEDLFHHFNQTKRDIWGNWTHEDVVKNAEVIFDRAGYSLEYGYFLMINAEKAEEAVQKFNNTLWKNMVLSVKKVRPKQSRIPENTSASGVYAVSNRIFVQNLPSEVDESRLKDMFSKHGRVVYARIVYDQYGHSSCCGYVSMHEELDVLAAIDALDEKTVDCMTLKLTRPKRDQRTFL